MLRIVNAQSLPAWWFRTVLECLTPNPRRDDNESRSSPSPALLKPLFAFATRQTLYATP